MRPAPALGPGLGPGLVALPLCVLLLESEPRAHAAERDADPLLLNTRDG